jgi:hypothetical protein
MNMTKNIEVFLVLKDGTTVKIAGEASIVVIDDQKPPNEIETWFNLAATGEMRIEKEAKVALKKL